MVDLEETSHVYSMIWRKRSGKSQVKHRAKIQADLIRGDAPPRYTDLAYELPEDFDPYALPDPDDLMNTTTVAAGPIQSAGLGGSALTEFFAANASPQNTRADAVDLLPLPDLVETPLSEHGSPMIPSPRIGGLERYGIIEEEGLTLEEIGRKRHKEWLERSRSEAW